MIFRVIKEFLTMFTFQIFTYIYDNVFSIFLAEDKHNVFSHVQKFMYLVLKLN